jgi:hypothetical protein
MSGSAVVLLKRFEERWNDWNRSDIELLNLELLNGPRL